MSIFVFAENKFFGRAVEFLKLEPSAKQGLITLYRSAGRLLQFTNDWDASKLSPEVERILDRFGLRGVPFSVKRVSQATIVLEIV